MKPLTILFITIFICSPLLLRAQPDTVKYSYCELIGTARLFSNKVTIDIDFGEAKNVWLDNRVRDEQTGKVRIFNSMVDALNYMGSDGWEFVQAYVVTVGQQNVYHWLLKKRRRESK
ncbi:hypothetical protein KK083_15835 [Fulvivirgaceae bacterium PWU4]|uniref:DUF4177 domain-containing protein n=1 Tax=Chryseosolibacter histidini TaxID=2782349 RepID=A0AAP2GJH2_9BACT|nr:hypothetical protein [Chryseosolibacter histidini]MBT1698361.1 hypothetical protein [Chryseosolibacter histidini]